MAVTNMMQKHFALTIGNLYASKKVADLTSVQLKEMLESGDDSMLKSLYCFSGQIKCTSQYFSQFISKSTNFLRHLRIMSEGEDMFNLFLTFIGKAIASS